MLIYRITCDVEHFIETQICSVVAQGREHELAHVFDGGAAQG